MTNNKLKLYSDEITNWNFDKEQLSEFLRLLTDRNILIYNQTPLIDFYPNCDLPSKNEALINHNSITHLEHMAFHVGLPHQKRLYPLTQKNTNVPNNEGVFFTLDPKDVNFFSNFKDNLELMIYFLNLDSAKDLRVQINYKSSVISRYDLDVLIPLYASKSKKFLKEKHLQLNKLWINENTTPFELDRIKELKEKDYDWLIVPAPINVKY